MRLLALWVLLCAPLAAVTHAHADARVELEALKTQLPLGPHFEHLEDRYGTLDLDDVIRATPHSFTPTEQRTPNFGLRRTPFWFHARIAGARSARRLLTEVSYPVLDEVDFYLVDDHGKLLSRLSTGSSRPFSARVIGHRHFLFPFFVGPDEVVHLYLRVRSSVSMQVPATLWAERAFTAQDQSNTILQGMYAGFMVVMIFYNFFLFLALRERAYMLYSPMVLGQLIFQLTLHGLSEQYLWPERPALTRILAPVIIFFATVSANAFAMAFLDLERHAIRWSGIARAVRAACLLGMIASPFISFDLGIVLGSSAAVVACFTVLVAFLLLWDEARRQVIMLGVAWGPLLLGTLLLVAQKFGLIERGFWSENLVQLGSAIEVVVLSIALGDRISHEREQKLHAQELALAHERAAQRAEHDALVTQRRANETLEQRVEARTRELAEANARLGSLRTVDPLTGLRNRRYFGERLHEELARATRDENPLSVVLIGIDHFERIDEQHGRGTGDQCVCAVADALRATVSRATDTLAHHGAAEFAILLPGTDALGAQKVAETLRGHVEGLAIEAEGELLHLTISVGLVSCCLARAEPRPALLGAALTALERARREGGNRIVENRGLTVSAELG